MNETPSPFFTFNPTVNMEPRRLIGLDYGVCQAGNKPLGITTEKGATANEASPFVMSGVKRVEAGAAINNLDALESDANGKAITKTTGETIGYALEAASAAGEFILVRLS